MSQAWAEQKRLDLMAEAADDMLAAIEAALAGVDEEVADGLIEPTWAPQARAAVARARGRA